MRASETIFIIIFIYQCNLLTITNNNHECYHKKGALFFKKKKSVFLIKDERASNTAENAPFIPWGASFYIFHFLYEKSGDDLGSAVPKGTNLRVNSIQFN